MLLGNENEFDDLEAQVSQTCLRFGLVLSNERISDESLEDIDDTLAREVTKASLLIAPLRNVPSDSFVHFATGIVVAQPRAGASSRRLSRRVILVVENVKNITILTADSARRAVGTVRAVPPASLTQELVQYGKIFQRWFQKQEE